MHLFLTHTTNIDFSDVLLFQPGLIHSQHIILDSSLHLATTLKPSYKVKVAAIKYIINTESKSIELFKIPERI